MLQSLLGALAAGCKPRVLKPHLATPHRFARVLYAPLPSRSFSVEPNTPQRAAIEETKAVFPPLRERITNAILKLEDQLEAGQESGASEDEITKAKDVIQQAKAAVEKK